ncbi:MAG: hypothetical protein K2N87_16055 [Eubacterium sp.]|nr:hypothetical protein [Eubacterium sp.]
MRNVTELLEEKLWIARPLSVIEDECEKTRFNIVTDDIGRRSLMGGVATSLALATILCEKNQWILRIITRQAPCSLNDYYAFVRLYGLQAPEKVEAYSDEEKNSVSIHEKLAVSEKDIFLATSWWSARSILKSHLNRRILYIIQEEETFFYPYGDERFWCEEMMKDQRIDYIVNSRLLYDYFKANGYDMLINHAVCFEPAFPKNLFYADHRTFARKQAEKRKLFFYSRPKNPRNLYYLGMECLDEALNRGIIDTDLWEIYLAGGQEDEEICFSNGYIPKRNGIMSWKEYADFARTVDVSFSLMYTPHPSYPPLDMLCSGAVVLTNQFKNKNHLDYSKNLILAELKKEQLVQSLEKAVFMAEDLEQREKNYQQNEISQSWNDSFQKVIAVLEKNDKEGRYVPY